MSIGNDGTRFCVETYIMTLCYLTLWTVVYIFGYILVHCVPIEALPAQGNGPLHTLMTLSNMQHLKHLHLVLNREDHLMVLYIIIDV